MDESRSLRGEWTKAYSSWALIVERALENRHWQGGFYPEMAIRRRLLQRVTDLAYEKLLQGWTRQFGKVEGQVAGLHLDSRGWFKPSMRLWVREMRYFLVLWTFTMLKIFKSLYSFDRTWSPGPAALVADLGANVSSNGSDARLVRFVECGPVTAMNVCSRWIFQTVRSFEVTDPRRFKYSRWPVLSLFEINRPSIGHWLWTLGRHFSHLARFVLLSLARPEFVLLSRDFALTAIYESLHRRHLIEGVFITDANYANQELFLAELPEKTADLHFVWHSQNVRGILVEGETFQWEYPQRRFMKMDQNWFWTPSFQKWLESHGLRAGMHAVGPIMFETPIPETVEHGDEIGLCVFDVTPTHEKWQIENGWPFIYYNRDVSIRFLEDILRVADELRAKTEKKVVVRLKHKRQYGPIHDRGYIEFVEKLATSGQLMIELPETNIFGLIHRSDLVLAIPFTSAALIAKVEGTKAAFYDPTGEVWVADDMHIADVPLVKGRAALSDLVWSAFAREVSP